MYAWINNKYIAEYNHIAHKLRIIHTCKLRFTDIFKDGLLSLKYITAVQTFVIKYFLGNDEIPKSLKIFNLRFHYRDITYH